MKKSISTLTITMLLLFGKSYSQSNHTVMIESYKQNYTAEFVETSYNTTKEDPLNFLLLNYNSKKLSIINTNTDVELFDVDATQGKSKNKSATMIQYQFLGVTGRLTKISLPQYQNSLIDIKKRRSLQILREQSKVLEMKYFINKQKEG